MRLLICDDERQFAEDLRQRIIDFLKEPSWKITINCISNVDQMVEIDASQYDIAFLDIDMDNLNGIDLAHKMRACNPDLILIFVTNYIQYSLEGYEVHALRYLLKSQLSSKLPDCLNAAITAYRKERSFVRLSSDNVEIDISPTHITYVETDGRRLKLHLKNEPRDVLMINMTMMELTELLQERGFLRVHQSYLVNMLYVQQMKSTGVWLTDSTRLPISARNYKELKQNYLRWKGMKRWSI